MSELLKFLKREYPNGDDGELSSVMLDKFGVNVKQEGHLYLFKYGIIDVKWAYSLTRECRGMICSYTDKNGWEIQSHPFDKFFNQDEGRCPIFEENVFNEKLAKGDLTFVEKHDGTCIQVWFDSIKSEWRVSTLGCITTMNVYDWDITFEELFFEVLGVEKERFFKFIDDNGFRESVLIFELCSSKNQIVTQYPTPRIYLIGIRANDKLLDYVDLVAAYIFLRTLSYNIGIPDVTGMGKSLKDVKFSMTTDLELTECKYPEGFVVYDGGVPIAKMKYDLYKQLHNIVGDVKHTRKIIIEAVLKNTIDDIIGVLSDSMKEYADKVKDFIVKEVHDNYDMMQSKLCFDFETQKDFALAVQRVVSCKFMPFCFQNKGLLVKGDATIDDLFSWVRSYSDKLFKHYKEDIEAEDE